MRYFDGWNSEELSSRDYIKGAWNVVLITRIQVCGGVENGILKF